MTEEQFNGLAYQIDLCKKAAERIAFILGLWFALWLLAGFMSFVGLKF